MANNGVYVFIPHELFTSGLDSYAIAAYVAIATHQNWKTGEAFPGFERLRGMAKQSKARFSKSLNALDETSWFTRDKKREKANGKNRKSNTYVLPLPVREVNNVSSPDEHDNGSRGRQERSKGSSLFNDTNRTQNKRSRSSRSNVKVVDPEMQERRVERDAMFYAQLEGKQEQTQTAPRDHQYDQELRTADGESKIDLVERMKAALKWHKSVQRAYAPSKQQRGKLTIVAPEPVDDIMTPITNWLRMFAPDLAIDIRQTA